MADLTSGDRLADSTNGTIEGQQESIAPAPGAHEHEQTVAERDQTLADADQTAADSDQAAADTDQAAADTDQAASDHDLRHGGDPDLHDVTRDIRDRTARQRRQTAEERGEAATARDAAARAFDLAASARDQAAASRDHALAARAAAWAGDRPAVTRGKMLLRAAESRRRADADRAAAAESRARDAADREQATRDREAHDRLQAQADRDALLHQLAVAETDALTGTRTRGAGLADLDHEIDRARRTTGLLVVAYVDVVGLKAVNDSRGHSAGDALLQCAVAGIRDQLRSYDSIVRLGGDEFLCVLCGATIEDARQRFGAVQAGLAAGVDPCEIKVGFAALSPQDSSTELIERADAELPVSPSR